MRPFGRRTILLHLSGFPCQYQRRVIGTKSTTSNGLFILSIYITIISIYKVFSFFTRLFHSFLSLLKCYDGIFVFFRVYRCF